MKNLLMVAVAAIAFSSLAQAQDQGRSFAGAYAGVQLGSGNGKINLDSSGSKYNFNAQAFGANAMFGYGQLLDRVYLGGEFFIGQDTYDHKLYSSSATLKFKSKTNFGLSGRLGYLVAQRAMVYFSVGAIHDCSEIKFQINPSNYYQMKKSGFTLVPGMGSQVGLTDETSLRLDYTYQPAKSMGGGIIVDKYKVSKSTFKVGVAYHF